MRVLIAASEVYPLIKTGGLADVAGALPAALARKGLDARIVMPGYPSVLARLTDRRSETDLGPVLEGHHASLIESRMPDSGVPVWLVDCPSLYHRGGGPYINEWGHDHPDNFLRFALLSKVAALLGTPKSPVGWQADVIQCNDWQTGLVPAYLALTDGPGAATVFSIHNIQFQGIFGPEILPLIGLPGHAFAIDGLEFYGHVSTLKAGCYYADRITTVSPTYAREIQTPDGGRGMDGLLRWRAAQLSGILNGVDYDQWDPARDHLLPARYSADDMTGKAACKAALQREFGLEERPEALVFGLVSRFSEQKGIDLVLGAVDHILSRGGQIVMQGSGDSWLEHAIYGLGGARAGRVGTWVGYDEGRAHRIQAGCDVFLVPSRFEPCGLTQMYALRYGSLPLVRHTGGLADTVTDIHDPGGQGTGFVFGEASVAGLVGAIDRAFDTWGGGGSQWGEAQRRGMAQDFGWHKAADAYIELFRALTTRE
ncbi:glycogen synthase GlgA [Caenispirillum bisanense]|uniref:glycogen synthase GlgA n=1 Tax=Caenispirillum bisanense TaxID=414052 RepID=UPI0031DE0E03